MIAADVATAPTPAAPAGVRVPIGCFWQEDPVKLRMVRVWRSIQCATPKIAAFTRDLYDVQPEWDALFQRWQGGDETAVLADEGAAEDDPADLVRAMADDARKDLRAQLGAAPDPALVARQVADAARPEDVRRILAWALVDLVREAGDAERRAHSADLGPRAGGVYRAEREPRMPYTRTATMAEATRANTAAINAAFAGTVQVATGYKPLVDCTAGDLDWIADQHAARARGELVAAVRFRRLAMALREAGAERVADLPEAARAAAMETRPAHHALTREVVA